jgi:hypothetical protein
MIPSSLDGHVSSLRLVVIALAVGAWMFPLVFVLAMEPQGDGTAGPITFTAIAMVLLTLAMGAFLPAALTAQGRARIASGRFQTAGSAEGRRAADEGGDVGRLMNLYRGATIVGAAAIEGGALFSSVAYVVEGSRWMLLPAFLLPLVILLLRLPSRRCVEEWLETQQRLLARERGGA